MDIKFIFNKWKIVFGVVFFIVLNIVSIWFIREPEVFVRNFLMKDGHIQGVGVLSLFYSFIMLCSFISLLFRGDDALIISDSYLIDNSRFESVGKIYFSEVKKVKRIKKNSLEIVLIGPVFKLKRLSVLKKIVHVVNNWNCKNRIIVSSALLHGDIAGLERAIMEAMKSKGQNSR